MFYEKEFFDFVWYGIGAGIACGNYTDLIAVVSNEIWDDLTALINF